MGDVGVDGDPLGWVGARAVADISPACAAQQLCVGPGVPGPGAEEPESSFSLTSSSGFISPQNLES